MNETIQTKKKYAIEPDTIKVTRKFSSIWKLSTSYKLLIVKEEIIAEL